VIFTIKLKPTLLLLCGILMYIFSIFSAHSQCLEGWRDYEGKCYFFSTDTKTWTEANAFCSEQNSDLMSIQDVHERVRNSNTNDVAAINVFLSFHIFWIGLNDHVVEGVYEWSDGSPFIEYLQYWMPGQPDNWGDEPGEDCGQVVGSSFGQWNDENCNVKRKYICKHINGKSMSMHTIKFVLLSLQLLGQ
uniref:C-type lectin domain-containing protein n=1 Tax=Amphiprion percula TaxID=161767 RepID=A0A3P8TJI4_AMPPE